MSGNIVLREVFGSERHEACERFRICTCISRNVVTGGDHPVSIVQSDQGNCSNLAMGGAVGLCVMETFEWTNHWKAENGV
jgi:hypothetical protein